ncbi:MAG: hypothetical protein ACREQ8_02860 [Woeseiaceae bacterium]
MPLPVARIAAFSDSIAVLRFDFTGRGESEGEFADTTFSNNISDRVAATDYRRVRFAVRGRWSGEGFSGAP